MREAVIIEAVRTPIGRRNGTLSGIRPDDLAAMVLKEVVRHPSGTGGRCIMGCVTQTGEQARDIGTIGRIDCRISDGSARDHHRPAMRFQPASRPFCRPGDIKRGYGCGCGGWRGKHVPRSDVFQFSRRLFSEKLTSRYEMIHQGISAERIADKWGFSRGTARRIFASQP